MERFKPETRTLIKIYAYMYLLASISIRINRYVFRVLQSSLEPWQKYDLLK